MNLDRGDQKILLVVIISNYSYRGELKLRKIVINDWVCVFPRVVSGDGERVVGR